MNKRLRNHLLNLYSSNKEDLDREGLLIVGERIENEIRNLVLEEAALIAEMYDGTRPHDMQSVCRCSQRIRSLKKHNV